MTTPFKLISPLIITLAVGLFANTGMAHAANYTDTGSNIQTVSAAVGMPVSSAAMLNGMFAEHNAQRAAAGLGALTWDTTLEAVAQARAVDMATQNYFDHVSPQGIMAFDLLDQAGYVASAEGENIDRNNYSDAQSAIKAMDSFMHSPTHRANIMNSRFSRVGMSVIVGDNGMKYFAVIFAG